MDGKTILCTGPKTHKGKLMNICQITLWKANKILFWSIPGRPILCYCINKPDILGVMNPTTNHQLEQYNNILLHSTTHPSHLKTIPDILYKICGFWVQILQVFESVFTKSTSAWGHFGRRYWCCCVWASASWSPTPSLGSTVLQPGWSCAESQTSAISLGEIFGQT